MKTLVCLVSRQVMANLIPILTLKVKKVELLYTNEEKRAHKNLKRVLKNVGLDFEINEHLVDAYDFEGIKEICNTLISKNKDIILNTTGGTKVMAFAAYTAFSAAKKPIFYLDSFNSKAIYLDPYSEAKHPVKIDLDTMLAAHGYKIIGYKKEADMLPTKPLAIYLTRYFPVLSGCFQQYRRFMHDQVKHFSPIINHDFNFEICSLKKGGVRVRFDRKEVILNDPNYLDGLWLEEMVYWMIRKNKWDDLRVGVSLTYFGAKDEPDPLNEVDVMGIKNGKLYLFSCKSGITKDKKDIFELEALRSLAGGTFGKAYFITSAPISKEKHLYERCRELGIEIFDHRKFLKLMHVSF